MRFGNIDDTGELVVTGSSIVIGSASFDSLGRPASSLGTDVFFFTSGSIGSKDGADPGVALFGGDFAVSGSTFLDGDAVEITGSLTVVGGNTTLEGGIIEITGSLTVTGGISGSLTTLADGTAYLRAGPNITIASGSGGWVEISGSGGGGDSYFVSPSSGTVGFLYTTGSVAFSGGADEYQYVTGQKGSDVFFYVSGSLGSKDGADPGVALFGGDVVISGTLYGGSPLKVAGGMVVTGSLSVSGTYVLNVVSGTVSTTYSIGLTDHVVVFIDNNVTGVLNASSLVGTQIIFKDGTGAASTAGGQMLSASIGGVIDGSQTYTMQSVDYTSTTLIKVNDSPETWIVV